MPGPADSGAGLGWADSAPRRHGPLTGSQAEKNNRECSQWQGDSTGVNSQLSNVPHQQRVGAYLANGDAVHMRREAAQQPGRGYPLAAERTETPLERRETSQRGQPAQVVQHHTQHATCTARSLEQPTQAVARRGHGGGAPATAPLPWHAQAQQQVGQEPWHQRQPDSVHPGAMLPFTPTPLHAWGGEKERTPSCGLQLALSTSNGAADPLVRETLQEEEIPEAQAQSDKAALTEALRVVKPLLKGLYSQDLLSREQFKQAAKKATRLLHEKGQD